MVNFADAVGKLSVGKTMVRKPNANQLKSALKNNVTTNNLFSEYNGPKLLQPSFLIQDLSFMTIPHADPQFYNNLRASGQYKPKTPPILRDLFKFMDKISK